MHIRMLEILPKLFSRSKQKDCRRKSTTYTVNI